MCFKLLLAAEPLPKIARLPPTRKHELAEVIILDIKPTNRLHICVSMLQSLQIIGNRLQCVLYGRRITLRTHFGQLTLTFAIADEIKDSAQFSQNWPVVILGPVGQYCILGPL